MSNDEMNEDAAKSHRKLLLKIVGIPESKPYSIIIPPNDDLNGFYRRAYHEENCKDYITKSEFDEVIDNV